MEFLILAINCGLLTFLFLKARKMLYLLKLYLLYLAVILASSNIIITPQILISFVLLLLMYYFVTKYSVMWDCEQTIIDNQYLKSCVRVILFYCLLVLFRYCVVVTLRNISTNCSVLPARPQLTAHRGCKDVSNIILFVCCILSCLSPSQNYPENSIGAFEGTCSNINSVTTLETDVHIR